MSLVTLDAEKLKTFKNKVAMLDIDLYEQVNMLNQMYNGKVKFKVNQSLKSIHNIELNEHKGIEIDYIDSGIDVLELPDIDNFCEGIFSVNTYFLVKLKTLKIPSSWKIITDTTYRNIGHVTQSLFIWDTTEIKTRDDVLPRMGLNLKRIVIRSSAGKEGRMIELK